MATLSEIEKLTKEFSDAREALAGRVQTLEEEIAALKRRYLPSIKKAVTAAAEVQSQLRASIEESPELFVKPRTYIFHGIKVGYQKGKGKLQWEDDEQVVRLIKKHWPASWELYVKIAEKPIRSALETLSVADLKRIGVTADDTGDAIIIKSTDTEIERLVNALLKDEEIKEVKDAA